MKLKTFIFFIIISILSINSYAQDKPTLVVMDLKAMGGITKDDAAILSERLRSALTKTGKYTILSREEMDNIVKEAKFQMSDMCDDTKCFAEIGGALGAKKMVTGNIGKLGKTYTLTLKLIDITEVKVDKSLSNDCKCEIDELLVTIDESAFGLVGAFYSGPKRSLNSGGTGKNNLYGNNKGKGVGSFFIRTKPEGAKVTIDGVLLDGETPLTVEDVAAGKHNIFINKGIYIAEKKVVLNADEFLKLDLKLNKLRGKIKFKTKPYDVSVFLDREFIGKTPLIRKDVEGGEHTVVFKRDNYVDMEKKIVIKDTGTMTIEETLKKAGKIKIESNVYGANIYIDDKLMGKTEINPTVIDKLSVGVHEMKIEKTGYNKVKSEIKVRFRKIVRLRANLTESTGFINIDSNPPGAVVFIDGKEAGKTPILEEKLKVGNHRVSMQLKGYKAHQEKIVIEENKTHRLVGALKKAPKKKVIAHVKEPDIKKILKPTKEEKRTEKSIKKLKKSNKPWYKSTWLWVAAGAVVSGSAAAFLLASDDAEIATGSFTIEFPEPNK